MSISGLGWRADCAGARLHSDTVTDWAAWFHDKLQARACSAVTDSATLPSRKASNIDSCACLLLKKVFVAVLGVSRSFSRASLHSSNAAIAFEREQPRRSKAQPLSQNAWKMMGMLILQIKGMIDWLAITCTAAAPSRLCSPQ